MTVKYILLAVLLITLSAFSANAQSVDTPPDTETEESTQDASGSPDSGGSYTDDDVLIMEDMSITERVYRNDTIGKTEVPRSFIDTLPKGNGSVTDLLQFAPSVQYDELYRSPSSAGEIAPAEISISGGRIYENLYMLDGMNNSSAINPGNKSVFSTSDVPANSQKFYIDTWLIDDITLYDSNIPASYDGFTGGVVEMNTIRPKQNFGGSLSYRTTRSEWTKFHMTDQDKSQLAQYYSSAQPDFSKNFFAASVNFPITADTAAIASYSYNQSEIPIVHFDGWRSNKRESETFFLKASHNFDGLNYIDVSASYSPNYALYFIKNAMYSDFVVEGGGYYAATTYTRQSGGGGETTFHADYSQNNSNRDAPDAYKSWIASSYKPWGYRLITADGNIGNSNEGGLGNLNQMDKTLTLNFDHSLDPVELLGEHKISYGVLYSNITGRYNRPTDGIIYDGAVASSMVICNGDTESCIAGDQYFARRTTNPASDVTANINEYAAYAEDSWDFSRFNLRLGLRVTTDDYMNNVNLSPRSQISYDIFDNSNTVLVAGYSRYYSSNLLANKLQEGKLPSILEKRFTTTGVVQDWQVSNSNYKFTYNFKELDTPFVDEFSIGVTQVVLGTEVNLRYLKRLGRDEFALSEAVRDPQTGIYYHELNNYGRTDYQSVQLAVTKSWRNHIIMFNATWQENTTTNNSYNSEYSLEESQETVILNGERVRRHDLPKTNFNRPWVINLTYSGRFFSHLTFSTMLKYRAPYENLVLVRSDYLIDTGEVDIGTGQPVKILTDEYSIETIGEALTVDVGVSWEQPLFWGTTLALSVDVTNLFNAKNRVAGVLYEEYELGRQFWLGANFTF